MEEICLRCLKDKTQHTGAFYFCPGQDPHKGYSDTFKSGKNLMDLQKKVVNHPEHYGGEDNPYEAIKVIEAWDLGFCLGNTIKYICRAGKKHEQGLELEDLRKAQWYLNRYIEFLETQKEAFGEN